MTLVSPDADRRALYQAAFGGQPLETDIREALDGASCEVPRGFAVEVRTAETGPRPFAIEYWPSRAAPAAAPAAAAPRSTVWSRQRREQAEYTLDKPRINIGRLAELTDSEQRIVRRNDVVFEEGADEANATVSRKHAHIRLDDGEYRICDDDSEFGTRVFRDGRSIEVPSGNRRGEKLRRGTRFTWAVPACGSSDLKSNGTRCKSGHFRLPEPPGPCLTRRSQCQVNYMPAAGSGAQRSFW